MGLTFIVLFMLFGELKKQFHPFELLGHKVDTEVTVKFETASDFDQEWNLGEIQCSMTKVVFVLDFWL